MSSVLQLLISMLEQSASSRNRLAVENMRMIELMPELHNVWVRLSQNLPITKEEAKNAIECITYRNKVDIDSASELTEQQKEERKQSMENEMKVNEQMFLTLLQNTGLLCCR